MYTWLIIDLATAPLRKLRDVIYLALFRPVHLETSNVDLRLSLEYRQQGSLGDQEYVLTDSV